MSTQVSLPIELTDEVASSLRTKTDMSSCSLVCREWRRGFQGRLLRTVLINPKRHTVQSFLDFVALADVQRERKTVGLELPSFSGIVRVIRIHSGNLFPEQNDECLWVRLADIRDILWALPRLEGVILGGIKVLDADFTQTINDGIQPLTLRCLTLEGITFSETELQNLFSLFRWTEELQIKGSWQQLQHIDSMSGAPAFLPLTRDILSLPKPGLAPTLPSFPSTFEGFRSLTLCHVQLPFFLGFFADVLRRKCEGDPESGQQENPSVEEISLVESIGFFAAFGEFGREVGGGVRELHIDTSVWSWKDRNVFKDIRSLNIPAFRSLCTLTITAPTFSYAMSMPTTLLAIGKLVDGCPDTLNKIVLNFKVAGRQLSSRRAVAELLQGINTKGTWMERLPQTRPKIAELTWNWLIEGSAAEDMQKARQSLNRGVMERLGELAEGGLLRFGTGET